MCSRKNNNNSVNNIGEKIIDHIVCDLDGHFPSWGFFLLKEMSKTSIGTETSVITSTLIVGWD